MNSNWNPNKQSQEIGLMGEIYSSFFLGEKVLHQRLSPENWIQIVRLSHSVKGLPAVTIEIPKRFTGNFSAVDSNVSSSPVETELKVVLDSIAVLLSSPEEV